MHTCANPAHNKTSNKLYATSKFAIQISVVWELYLRELNFYPRYALNMDAMQQDSKSMTNSLQMKLQNACRHILLISTPVCCTKDSIAHNRQHGSWSKPVQRDDATAAKYMQKQGTQR